MFRVATAVLEHRTPCLGFAIEETLHVNVWRNRLAELGLPVGPWLRSLKQAAIERRPDDYLLVVGDGPANPPRQLPFGELRSVLSVAPGQKIGYVTDVADTPANRAAIVELVKDADIFFVEAMFAAADAALAADRAHLTTAAAGEIARRAGVAHVEPFHFSPRYAGEEGRMLDEVATSFAGKPQNAPRSPSAC
jgi:ribonuclease Z